MTTDEKMWHTHTKTFVTVVYEGKEYNCTLETNRVGIMELILVKGADGTTLAKDLSPKEVYVQGEIVDAVYHLEIDFNSRVAIAVNDGCMSGRLISHVREEKGVKWEVKETKLGPRYAGRFGGYEMHCLCEGDGTPSNKIDPQYLKKIVNHSPLKPLVGHMLP